MPSSERGGFHLNHRTTCRFIIIAVLASVGCGERTADTTTTDSGILTDLNVSTNDGGLADDSGPGIPDALMDDVGVDSADLDVGDATVLDGCENDNGGCGDPARFRCDDRLGDVPLCNLIPDQDIDRLLEGIDTLEWGGALPDSIIVHGRRAFPVAVSENSRTFIAAARPGEGRVLHVSHESLMNFEGDELAGKRRFLENAMNWLLEGRGMRVLVEPGLEALRTSLADLGYEVIDLDGAPTADDAAVFLTTYGPFDADFADALVEYVQSGGALFSGGHAWWFSQSTGGDAATEYPGNYFLDEFGLVLTGRGDVGGDSLRLDERAKDPLLHARFALDALSDRRDELNENDTQEALATILHAIKVLPA